MSEDEAIAAVSEAITYVCQVAIQNHGGVTGSAERKLRSSLRDFARAIEARVKAVGPGMCAHPMCNLSRAQHEDVGEIDHVFRETEAMGGEEQVTCGEPGCTFTWAEHYDPTGAGHRFSPWVKRG